MRYSFARLGRRVKAMWWSLMGLSLAGCASASMPVGAAFSVEPWSEEGHSGRRMVTDHYDLVSTLQDAEFEAALPGFLEACHRRYQGTLPLPAPPDGKLTTLVFGSRSEWLRYVKRRFPSRYEVYARIWSGGFTEGDISVSFYTSRSATLAALAHEGWHQYVSRRLQAAIPAWLNEGLACWHEALEFADAQPRFFPQHNTLRINALREAVQTDKLLALSEVVDTDAGQVIGRYDPQKANVYYAQAWALVTFLKYGAGGRFAGAFETMLNDLARGTLTIRVSAARLGAAEGANLSTGKAAFRAYFGCAPEDVEGQYYDHVVRVSGF